MRRARPGVVTTQYRVPEPMDALSVVRQLRFHALQPTPSNEVLVRVPRLAVGLCHFLEHPDEAVKHEAAKALRAICQTYGELLLKSPTQYKELVSTLQRYCTCVNSVVQNCSQLALASLLSSEKASTDGVQFQETKAAQSPLLSNVESGFQQATSGPTPGVAFNESNSTVDTIHPNTELCVERRKLSHDETCDMASHRSSELGEDHHVFIPSPATSIRTAVETITSQSPLPINNTCDLSSRGETSSGITHSTCVSSSTQQRIEAQQECERPTLKQSEDLLNEQNKQNKTKPYTLIFGLQSIASLYGEDWRERGSVFNHIRKQLIAVSGIQSVILTANDNKIFSFKESGELSVEKSLLAASDLFAVVVASLPEDHTERKEFIQKLRGESQYLGKTTIVPREDDLELSKRLRNEKALKAQERLKKLEKTTVVDRVLVGIVYCGTLIGSQNR
ncbi:hypothetical protein IE077_004536 [Cardiosporidium cionae]|uniref:Uncharacterized protein n=1 Tax=Cardiosporidium cionae TaxID=476202 RepID=A0ABQ7JFA1_9APIC|nr:hypothetical protein IE077_004536 [Cardiosporidium cionae]|eukprot:KAF8822554.1 hypothetical protein IE077_004536 [Cardiosporidium cionae]